MRERYQFNQEESSQEIPKDAQEIHSNPERNKEFGERVEGGVWVPGIFDQYKDQVAVGASTKLLKRDQNKPDLRILGNLDRFTRPLRERVAAGRIIRTVLKHIYPEGDPKRVIKSQLKHTAHIFAVDEEFIHRHNFRTSQILETDGLVTNLRKYPLYASAADCNPVGIYDPKHNAIGLFHSGWRGTVRGVVPSGMQKMFDAYNTLPQDAIVNIGPGHSADFEIDQNILDMFEGVYGEKLWKFAKDSDKPGHYKIDLSQAIKQSLLDLGVPEEQIEVSNYHTDTNNDLFPSARKEKNPETGNDMADRFGYMMVLK